MESRGHALRSLDTTPLGITLGITRINSLAPLPGLGMPARFQKAGEKPSCDQEHHKERESNY